MLNILGDAGDVQMHMSCKLLYFYLQFFKNDKLCVVVGCSFLKRHHHIVPLKTPKYSQHGGGALLQPSHNFIGRIMLKDYKGAAQL